MQRGMGMKRRWAGVSFSRYKERFGGDGRGTGEIEPTVRSGSDRGIEGFWRGEVAI